MRSTQHLRYRIPLVAGAIWASLYVLQAQADIQSAVRSFLQAWYVDKKSPEELKSFVAKDNGFRLQPNPSPNRPSASRTADPLSALFTGAFLQPKVGERPAPPPKSLSEAIEYPPAKNQNARTNPGDIITNDFAIYKAESLPKGSYFPANQPTGNDPVANFLYHLTQTYKGNLYVVLYAVKGGGMLQETAVTYWIQEDGAWKLAAFMGTNW